MSEQASTLLHNVAVWRWFKLNGWASADRWFDACRVEESKLIQAGLV